MDLAGWSACLDSCTEMYRYIHIIIEFLLTYKSIIHCTAPPASRQIIIRPSSNRSAVVRQAPVSNVSNLRALRRWVLPRSPLGRAWHHQFAPKDALTTFTQSLHQKMLQPCSHRTHSQRNHALQKFTKLICIHTESKITQDLPHLRFTYSHKIIFL